MRALTEEELDLISGGGDIVVIGQPYPPPPPPAYYPPPPPYAPPTAPPSSGGGGGSTPAHSHTSPGGVVINYDGSLTTAQVAVMDAIADYGKAHHYSNPQIWNAIQQAYHESRLGANYGNATTQTSDGSHFGLFQYDTSSFKTWSPNGDIHNQSDQIAAMYHEYDSFTVQRYQDGVSAGKIPSGFSYDEYLEYKHHQPQGDGGATVGTAWTTYQSSYDRDSYSGPEAIKLKGVNQ